MLQHVFERAERCRLIDRVLIATDDDRIAETAKGFASAVVMTSSQHPSGTDRVSEAVSDIPAELIINIQGDEPLLHPESVDSLVLEMTTDPSVGMATLACKIADEADLEDRSCVKVVLDKRSDALYFSRSRIPYVLGNRPFDFYRHIGVYGYRRGVLEELVASPPSPLETAEGLEQLRAIEAGVRIRVVKVRGWGPSVDAPEDVGKVEKILSNGASESARLRAVT
jgi:3-deoxy-manno-octulosonate cytidylyltransferase (CMP-KDO synthetase)